MIAWSHKQKKSGPPLIYESFELENKRYWIILQIDPILTKLYWKVFPRAYLSQVSRGLKVYSNIYNSKIWKKSNICVKSWKNFRLIFNKFFILVKKMLEIVSQGYLKFEFRKKRLRVGDFHGERQMQ